MIPASYRRSQNTYWAILLAGTTRLLASSLPSDLNFYMAKESLPWKVLFAKKYPSFLYPSFFFFFKNGKEDTFLSPGNTMH